MSRFTVLFLLLAATAAPAFAEFKLPVPEQETLPNGLKVVWFVNDSLPVVNINLLVQAGYRDDPLGKSGTSQLLLEGLSRGSAGLSGQQMGAKIESLGASRYASSDEDTFSIGIHGLAPDADKLLDLVTQLALHPDFPELELKREQARLLDRWEHIGEYGETLATLAFFRAIAAGSSYGRGAFISAEEFKRVGRADVLSYYHRYFTPKNSVLMVVGRVKREEFRAKLIAAFGGWQGEAPQRDWKPFADKRLGTFKKNQVFLVNRPGLNQAQVRIGFKAPPFKHPDHYPLAVGNALLGEYFHSRLNTLIRDQLGLTYGIGSGFSYSRDFASFTISAATRNESVGQLVEKTLEVLEGIKKGPIEAEEIKVSKEYLEGGFPLSVSTLEAVASRWLAGFVFELGPEYLNSFVPRVRAVTQEQVQQAVARDFDLDHLIIVVAGDGAAIRPTLGALAQGRRKLSIRPVSVRDLR